MNIFEPWDSRKGSMSRNQFDPCGILLVGSSVRVFTKNEANLLASSCMVFFDRKDIV